VLGASVSRLVLLLSFEFTKWILIANLIAWPLAYFIMSHWLNTFVYRADFPLMLFFSASLFAFVIALLTVSYQALKTALSHPASILRCE
jgi:putative ABC transport system permease protein